MASYSPYNDVQTNYRTPDGQYFRSESDAQDYLRDQAKRAQDMAELNAAGMAAVDSFQDGFEKYLSYPRPAKNFEAEGYRCFHSKDWKGAIKAFNNAINCVTGPDWEDYEKKFLNYSTLSFGKEAIKKMVEKFLYEWKVDLANMYYTRYQAKLELGNRIGGLPDFNNFQKLEAECLEVERQNPHLKGIWESRRGGH